MFAEMTNYYFLNDILEKLPNSVEEKKEISKDLIFNFANFNTTSWFYKGYKIKKDKYKLYKKLESENFDLFFINLLSELSIRLTDDDLNYERLIFLYGIYTNHLLMTKLKSYILSLKSSTTNLYEAYNMIDYYLANKYEDINLKEVDLRNRFEDGFNYYEYQDNLLHNPLLVTYNMFLSKEYLRKSYKKKARFFELYGDSKFGFRKKLFRFISIFYKNVMSPHYFYKDKIDTKILNIPKLNYDIGEKKHNLNLIEFIDELEKEAIKTIEGINDYLFNNNDKKIRKIFNIPKERKM